MKAPGAQQCNDCGAGKWQITRNLRRRLMHLRRSWSVWLWRRRGAEIYGGFIVRKVITVPNKLVNIVVGP